VISNLLSKFWTILSSLSRDLIDLIRSFKPNDDIFCKFDQSLSIIKIIYIIKRNPNEAMSIQLLLGFENCFSKLESLRCDINFSQDILDRLAEVCKSIKNLVINAKLKNYRS